MAVVIRLARRGGRNNPSYKVVVADKRYPRDGKFIEIVGYYSPLTPKDDFRYFKVDHDRVSYWLSKGAKASDKIEFLMKKMKN